MGNPYSLENPQTHVSGAAAGLGNHAATPVMFSSSNGLAFDNADTNPTYIPT